MKKTIDRYEVYPTSNIASFIDVLSDLPRDARIVELELHGWDYGSSWTDTGNRHPVPTYHLIAEREVE